jgi:hypothetical protein
VRSLLPLCYFLPTRIASVNCWNGWKRPLLIGIHDDLFHDVVHATVISSVYY